jgi:hypothetical protein
MLIAFSPISSRYSHIPHHPRVPAFMDLKCESPSPVLALQIHDLNGRSDTIGEVVAEAAEQLV